MTELKQPVRGSKGADIAGPRNPEVELQNPDIFLPPATDNGGLPNLKFPSRWHITAWKMADGHVKSHAVKWVLLKSWLSSTCASPRRCTRNALA